jgi:hypothetical protein
MSDICYLLGQLKHLMSNNKFSCNSGTKINQSAFSNQIYLTRVEALLGTRKRRQQYLPAFLIMERITRETIRTQFIS